jgi:transposase, IS5 family
MRFLGLILDGRKDDLGIPERLTKAGAIAGLFKRIEKALRDAGYIAISGQLVGGQHIGRRAKAAQFR